MDGARGSVRPHGTGCQNGGDRRQMIQVGGALLAGFAIGPAVDAWITRRLEGRGLERPESWRPATRWLLSGILGMGGAPMLTAGRWRGVLAAHLVWATVTASVVITDLEHRLIPNRILYPGAVAIAVLLVAGALLDGTPGRLGNAALGAGLCLLGMGALSVLGRGALGMGDVKLSAVLGLVCGYWGVEVALRAILSGFLIGGAAAVALIIARRAHRGTQLPFAPFLVAGAWWAILLP
ncbi:MAG: prepilin peptidase [Gammaproteobacteria bacterium]|nr:prepilin peptidase [Gammaproteobacteria bacterium]